MHLLVFMKIYNPDCWTMFSLDGELQGTSLHSLQIILTSDIFIVIHGLFYYKAVTF
jgi:hypothetical protein